MKNLEVGDSEQVHAAFLVYMDLSEGEFEDRDSTGAWRLLLFLIVCVLFRNRRVIVRIYLFFKFLFTSI